MCSQTRLRSGVGSIWDRGPSVRIRSRCGTDATRWAPSIYIGKLVEALVAEYESVRKRSNAVVVCRMRTLDALIVSPTPSAHERFSCFVSCPADTGARGHLVASIVEKVMQMAELTSTECGAALGFRRRLVARASARQGARARRLEPIRHSRRRSISSSSVAPQPKYG